VNEERPRVQVLETVDHPWVYLKHVLTELPARSPCAYLTDLLADVWARSQAGPLAVPG
jgi:hypothetical protein